MTSRMRPGRRDSYPGLVRIATRLTEFFRIPPDRDVEFGTEVEIWR
jgi:K+ transporter